MIAWPDVVDAHTLIQAVGRLPITKHYYQISLSASAARSVFQNRSCRLNPECSKSAEAPDESRAMLTCSSLRPSNLALNLALKFRCVSRR